MKLMLEGECVHRGTAFGAICGVGCDEVVFNLHDLYQMASAGEEKTHEWLRSVVLTRFFPNNVEHRTIKG